MPRTEALTLYCPYSILFESFQTTVFWEELFALIWEVLFFIFDTHDLNGGFITNGYDSGDTHYSRLLPSSIFFADEKVVNKIYVQIIHNVSSDLELRKS